MNDGVIGAVGKPSLSPRHRVQDLNLSRLKYLCDLYSARVVFHPYKVGKHTTGFSWELTCDGLVLFKEDWNNLWSTLQYINRSQAPAALTTRLVKRLWTINNVIGCHKKLDKKSHDRGYPCVALMTTIITNENDCLCDMEFLFFKLHMNTLFTEINLFRKEHTATNGECRSNDVASVVKNMKKCNIFCINLPFVRKFFLVTQKRFRYLSRTLCSVSIIVCINIFSLKIASLLSVKEPFPTGHIVSPTLGS